jgi:hypothetical protein
MTPSTCSIAPGSVHDDRLWQTNPVWCVEKLLHVWSQTDRDWNVLPYRLKHLIGGLTDRGIQLPLEALRKWVEHGLLDRGFQPDAVSEYPCLGVVGLLVDSLFNQAWVVPLLVEKASEWSADPTLPFRPPTLLQDLLIRLLLALGLPSGGSVPERFAFAIRDSLGRPSDGPSMQVAGVLAVVRAANGGPPLLSRACTVVQPDGDRLVPVGVVRPKLDAFLRECGRGTLLVRPPRLPGGSSLRWTFRRRLGSEFSQGPRRVPGPCWTSPRFL